MLDYAIISRKLSLELHARHIYPSSEGNRCASESHHAGTQRYSGASLHGHVGVAQAGQSDEVRVEPGSQGVDPGLVADPLRSNDAMNKARVGAVASWFQDQRGLNDVRRIRLRRSPWTLARCRTGERSAGRSKGAEKRCAAARTRKSGRSLKVHVDMQVKKSLSALIGKDGKA